jgi:hypothetical protein
MAPLGVMAAVDGKTPRQQGWPCRYALRLTRQRDRSKQHAVGPIRPIRHHIHAVVNAVAHIHIKPPRLTKQGFVAGGAAAVTVAGRVVLRIRLRFHNHAPQQLASGLAFHQQAADQLGGNDFGAAGEEGLGEALGEVGGYGSGLGDGTGICGNYIKSIYAIFGAIKSSSTWQPSI